jgi:hypothetical protein
MNGEVERIWKEAVVAWFKAGLLFWNLFGRTEESHLKLTSG